MSERTILHADMDAFYAAIEQRDDPSLRGRPVIVGGLGRRGVVSTASYEAREFGVRSAMPTAEARRRCPDGVYVRPRMEVYVGVSEQVQAVFERCTPLVEPLSLDEAFLDVTGSRALLGGGPEIAERIQREVRTDTGLTVSVGVARTKFVAKVASDLHKPNGITVVEPGREVEFLDGLPVARLWGAGPVTQQRLLALGLRTIGDVRRVARAVLAQRVGVHVAEHFQELAAGIDPRPVVPEREAKTIGNETTFEHDLVDDDAVFHVLLELSEHVGRRLRRNGVRGRLVRLKLRFPPFRTITRQVTLRAPTDDDLVIYQTARALCEAARRTGEPVRLLGVTAGELRAVDEDAPRQLGLFDAVAPPVELDPRRAKLSKAVDAIRDRFGDDAIRRGG